MQMNNFKKAFITGGTGFIGSHVVRKVLERGLEVRCLVRPNSPLKNLEGLDIEYAEGDLRSLDTLIAPMKGCDVVFHAAADYRLWAKNPQEIFDSNVAGTRNMFQAAKETGITKIVYTSSVAAVGRSDEGPGDETIDPVPEQRIGAYKESKYKAELIAREFGKQGLHVVIVNPSTPIGSRDIKPTPTGQIILDFLKGNMPGYVDTGLNFVDVEDVAEGHLLALYKGRPNRGDAKDRYILGNRNMTLRQMLELLARITSRKAPVWKIPYSVALAAGHVSTVFARLTGNPPGIPVDGVRMSKKQMYYHSDKAIKELGLPQTSIEDSMKKAVRWFKDNGYLDKVP